MRAISRREEHIGELKLSVWADSLPELLAEVARFIARETGRLDNKLLEWQPIRVESPDNPALLVDWANELLGRSEVERTAFTETRMLKVERGVAEGQIRGKRVRTWRSPLKAATLHDLQLEKRDGRWRALILFDV